jgi:hypothetical protein
MSESHISGCGRIYPKGEATFGFDRDGELFFLAGMELITGNFGDELKNIENLPLNLQQKTPAGGKCLWSAKIVKGSGGRMPKKSYCGRGDNKERTTAILKIFPKVLAPRHSVLTKR